MISSLVDEAPMGPTTRESAKAEHGDLAEFIRIPRRGEILVGGLRMCLIDIDSGFRTIREAMEELVGPVSRTILYNAGAACGLSFAEKVIKEGKCEPGPSAFVYALECYAVAGFGGFEVKEVDAERVTALVTCEEPAAFEASTYLGKQEKASRTVCDYSRGVIAGFLMAAIGRNNLLTCEISCRATGDSACTFIVGEEGHMIEREILIGRESCATPKGRMVLTAVTKEIRR